MGEQNGFTLIELMITTAISGLVLVAIHSVYKSQQRSYLEQEQVAVMQQNLRGGAYCMQREIRMAGFDPLASGKFGITDVHLAEDGNGTITFTADDNLNDKSDKSDGNGMLDSKETFTYSLYDYPTDSPDGLLDLGRKNGVRRQLLAQNIDAVGFAYAFDTTGDGDNLLDSDGKGNVIWAIDSDNDNDLDVNLDTDNDGDIDIDDDSAGKNLAHVDNGGLSDVQLSDIRAVKIWLLAKGDKGAPNSFNGATYAVANRRITPKDSYKRRLLTTTVRCRNMGLSRNN